MYVYINYTWTIPPTLFISVKGRFLVGGTKWGGFASKRQAAIELNLSLFFILESYKETEQTIEAANQKQTIFLGGLWYQP